MQLSKYGFNVDKISHVHWCISDGKSCISVCCATFSLCRQCFLFYLASMSLFVTIQAVMLVYKHYANNKKGGGKNDAVIVYP